MCRGDPSNCNSSAGACADALLCAFCVPPTEGGSCLGTSIDTPRPCASLCLCLLTTPAIVATTDASPWHCTPRARRGDSSKWGWHAGASTDALLRALLLSSAGAVRHPGASTDALLRASCRGPLLRGTPQGVLGPASRLRGAPSVGLAAPPSRSTRGAGTRRVGRGPRAHASGRRRPSWLVARAPAPASAAALRRARRAPSAGGGRRRGTCAGALRGARRRGTSPCGTPGRSTDARRPATRTSTLPRVPSVAVAAFMFHVKEERAPAPGTMSEFFFDTIVFLCFAWVLLARFYWLFVSE